jgi:hypothetical protein
MPHHDVPTKNKIPRLMAMDRASITFVGYLPGRAAISLFSDVDYTAGFYAMLN